MGPAFEKDKLTWVIKIYSGDHRIPSTKNIHIQEEVFSGRCHDDIYSRSLIWHINQCPDVQTNSTF